MISDHAPVMMKLRINEIEYRKGTWRLNEDLIEDIEVGKTITNKIEQFFTFNETPELTKATIWEANKVYIRGKLISIGAGKRGKEQAL